MPPAERPYWEIRLRNPKCFDEVLGRDVLNAFCRCFVQAGRLTSIIRLLGTCTLADDRESAACVRDRNTLLSFAVGTLRELGHGIRALRSALARRGRLDTRNSPWVALRALEDRSMGDGFYQRLRNVAAFHVDPYVIDAGLDILLEEPHLTLARSNGRKLVDGHLTLGVSRTLKRTGYRS